MILLPSLTDSQDHRCMPLHKPTWCYPCGLSQAQEHPPTWVTAAGLAVPVLLLNTYRCSEIVDIYNHKLPYLKVKACTINGTSNLRSVCVDVKKRQFTVVRCITTDQFYQTLQISGLNKRRERLIAGVLNERNL